jgi:hypothetical protein
MSKEILDKIKDLRGNNLYAVVREDGQVASVTKYKENIPMMISEEYCGVNVKLIKLTYNKQPMNYTLEAEIEDEDGFVNKHEFTIATTVYYN